MIVVFSRTLNSVAGNARLATDDIATEVGRLRYQPYTQGATMTLISYARWLCRIQWE